MLKRLGTEAAGRIARKTVVAGAKVIEQEIRDASPGRVKQEVGTSTPRTSDPLVAEAKVGIGVGRAARIAAVGVFLSLGTQERFRRTASGVASTGAVEQQSFVSDAIARATPSALAAMKRRMSEEVQREIKAAGG
jgi:uncharacterized protein with FMN-binding domain